MRYNPPSRFLGEVPPELATGHVRPRPGAAPVPAPTPAPAARGPAQAARDSTPSGVHVDFNEGQWSEEELPPIAVGSRVEHPVFGAGSVLEISGAGRTTKIRVRFDRAGLKTIVLRYAQLRLLA